MIAWLARTVTALVDLGKWANSFGTEWNINFNAGGNATDSDSREDESEDRRARKRCEPSAASAVRTVLSM